MLKIFVLSSGRSGTKYLSDLFKYNVKSCVSKHEPLPNMFGRPIYWRQQNKTDLIRNKFKKKKKKIVRYKKEVYIETNNAFLKSFSDVAIESFPEMKLIHLIRNPLEVARSELNKDIWIHTTKIKILYPFPKYYKADNGERYYIWTLTGREKIFEDVNIDSLTPYQKYVLQWIEIENRAMDFLDRYKKHNDCYTLASTADLNNREVLMNMFIFFGLELKDENIIMHGEKNKSFMPTIVSERDKVQFQEVVMNLPDEHLKIFQKKPYTELKWTDLVNRADCDVH